MCGGINSGLSALTGWLLNAYLIEAQGTLASEAGLVRTKRESSLLRWIDDDGTEQTLQLPSSLASAVKLIIRKSFNFVRPAKNS